MFFPSLNQLFRRSFFNAFVVSVALGSTALNAIAGPSFSGPATASIDASEYEEWGLEPPTSQSTPASGPVEQDRSDNTPPAQPAIEQPAQPAQQNLPPAPQDLTQSVQQATVLVIAVYPDGKEFHTAGWIVDSNRRIVVTLRHMVEGAEKIFVGFPQLSSGAPNELQGSPATLMASSDDMDVAYLVADRIPGSLPSLVNSESVGFGSGTGQTHGSPGHGPMGGTGGGPLVQTPPTTGGRPQPPTPPGPVQHGGHRPTSNFPPAGNGGFNNGGMNGGGFNNGGYNGGGFNGGGFGNNNPAQNNPVVGQWYLQDTVNGVQLYIGVTFNAQGQFALQMVTVDGYGQRSQENDNGSFQVQGNTLFLNGGDGPQQLPFWFENGMLFVQFPELGTTMAFHKG
ncbi:hypothetical protein AB1L42_09660 [Thalassoglobus sp. JC818]|uniref:hypothetical protein n=1 Tax=Thalassoglobus sp. JC818 TaxID=3232136 RepID=UPI0034578CCE